MQTDCGICPSRRWLWQKRKIGVEVAWNVDHPFFLFKIGEVVPPKERFNFGGEFASCGFCLGSFMRWSDIHLHDSDSEKKFWEGAAWNVKWSTFCFRGDEGVLPKKKMIQSMSYEGFEALLECVSSREWNETGLRGLLFLLHQFSTRRRGTWQLRVDHAYVCRYSLCFYLECSLLRYINPFASPRIFLPCNSQVKQTLMVLCREYL